MTMSLYGHLAAPVSSRRVRYLGRTPRSYDAQVFSLVGGKQQIADVYKAGLAKLLADNGFSETVDANGTIQIVLTGAAPAAGEPSAADWLAGRVVAGNTVIVPIDSVENVLADGDTAQIPSIVFGIVTKPTLVDSYVAADGDYAVYPIKAATVTPTTASASGGGAFLIGAAVLAAIALAYFSKSSTPARTANPVCGHLEANPACGHCRY